MSEPFLGEIKMVGFGFAPRGYAFCNGQLLPIQQNTALFSLLGTTYGGNGQTTYGLPDFRGRVPIHQGQGNGLSPRTLGELGGSENQTLITQEIPSHNHAVSVALPCSAEDADRGTPQNAYPAVPNGGGGAINAYAAAASPGNNLGAPSATCGMTGDSQPHNNMQPYLTVNFVIAVEGIFPARN